MIKKIDKKTRVKLKYHFPAWGYALCLQRKKCYGWITVSWIYPSIMKDRDFQSTIEWLEWKERITSIPPKEEKRIGGEIMNR